MDPMHLRLLDGSARDALKRLLGDSRNWFDGFMNELQPGGARAVGVLFRTRRDELVLFFDAAAISATFRGRSYYGGLAAPKPVEELQNWKERYARLELESK